MKTTIAITLLLLSPTFAFAQDAKPKAEPKPVQQEEAKPAPQKEVKPVKQEEARDEEAEAQEEGEVTEMPPLPPGVGQSSQDSTAEIIELFKKVDEKMKAIDELLFDIGAGELPLTVPKDSGLGDLLRMTKGASDDVVRDIDKILKIAEEMSKSQSQSSQSGSGQQGQKGESGEPKDGEGEKSEGEGEKPDGSDPSEEEGKEDQEGEDGMKPEEKDGEPNSGEESKDPGQNSPKGSAGNAKLGAGSQANQSERWGELPERLRETFRTQGGEDLPLFYRDWIESYYRHLNKGDSR